MPVAGSQPVIDTAAQIQKRIDDATEIQKAMKKYSPDILESLNDAKFAINVKNDTLPNLANQTDYLFSQIVGLRSHMIQLTKNEQTVIRFGILSSSDSSAKRANFLPLEFNETTNVQTGALLFMMEFDMIKPFLVMLEKRNHKDRIFIQKINPTRHLLL
jgi:hypothetical protein